MFFLKNHGVNIKQTWHNEQGNQIFQIKIILIFKRKVIFFLSLDIKV